MNISLPETQNQDSEDSKNQYNSKLELRIILFLIIIVFIHILLQNFYKNEF